MASCRCRAAAQLCLVRDRTEVPSRRRPRMVISHEYKYLFVELPLTGSTSVREELCSCYGGTPILYKHSTYDDFLRVADRDEMQYFSFSCVRNPLDQAVSRYFKYRTDHLGQYTDPARLGATRLAKRTSDRTKRRFVSERDASFADFFLRFYRLPYDNWSRLFQARLDFVMRFERLSDDFARALELLGIEQERPLPVANITAERGRDFASYYTPHAVRRAKRVFGPFMSIWGYEFPPDWGSHSVPWWNWAAFRLLGTFRMFYWTYLRYRVRGVL